MANITVKFEIKMEVDEKDFDQLKNLEHHADYLLDLDSWNEIKKVFSAKVTRIEDESAFKEECYVGDFVKITDGDYVSYGIIESLTPKKTRAHIKYVPRRFAHSDVQVKRIEVLHLTEQQGYSINKVVKLCNTISLYGCELGSSQSDIVYGQICDAAKKMIEEIVNNSAIE